MPKLSVSFTPVD